MDWEERLAFFGFLFVWISAIRGKYLSAGWEGDGTTNNTNFHEWIEESRETFLFFLLVWISVIRGVPLGVGGEMLP